MFRFVVIEGLRDRLPRHSRGVRVVRDQPGVAPIRVHLEQSGRQRGELPAIR